MRAIKLIQSSVISLLIVSTVLFMSGCKPSHLISLSPECGMPGDVFVINGRDLSDEPGEKIPSINLGRAYELEVLSWSDTRVRVGIPEDLSAGCYKVLIYYDNTYRTSSNSLNFLITDVPRAGVITEATLYEGSKTYFSGSPVCTYWREDGTIADDWEFFFPNIDLENDDIESLFSDIGLPTERTNNDSETWRRARVVWSWLHDHLLIEGDPNYEEVNRYRASLDHWASIHDLAHMFEHYGGFSWGVGACTCMCCAQTLATLLYRVGILPDRIAIAETRTRPEYSQHMYVVLRIGCHWYYIDPSCIPFHPQLSELTENVGCTSADYMHPNELKLLPGSTLERSMLVQ
ncbi:MAG: hypothetical protein JXD19_12880 [Deltaproteobacteria bacterium]|nr:hypothetical protein [Deltaproteobacteria bacterium]